MPATRNKPFWRTIGRLTWEWGSARGRLSRIIGRGLACLDAGDWDGAIREFSAALKVSPDDLLLRVFRGTAHAMGGGDYQSAIAELDESLPRMLDPVRRRSAYLCRAMAHEKLDQLGAAICDLDALLILDPGNAAAIRSRARLLILLGRYEEAAERLTELLERDCDDVESRYARAAAYACLGDVAAAREDIRAACAVARNHGGMLPGVTMQAHAADYWADDMKRPVRRIPPYGVAASAGDDDAASDGSTSAYELADASFNRALVYLMLGCNEERALSDLNEAIRLQPVSRFLRVRSIVYCALRRHDDVIREATAVIAIRPDRGEAHLARAAARFGLGDDVELIKADMDRAIELNPNNADLRRARALMGLMGRGRH